MPLIKNGSASVAAIRPTAEALQVENLKADKNDAMPDFVSVTNLQPDDMRAEQRRIQRSGLYQAALNSPALMQFCPTLEDYWVVLRKAADEGLKYVNELSA